MPEVDFSSKTEKCMGDEHKLKMCHSEMHEQPIIPRNISQIASTANVTIEEDVEATS
jgi:hypothetical protein